MVGVYKTAYQQSFLYSEVLRQQWGISPSLNQTAWFCPLGLQATTIGASKGNCSFALILCWICLYCAHPQSINRGHSLLMKRVGWMDATRLSKCNDGSVHCDPVCFNQHSPSSNWDARGLSWREDTSDGWCTLCFPDPLHWLTQAGPVISCSWP